MGIIHGFYLLKLKMNAILYTFNITVIHSKYLRVTTTTTTTSSSTATTTTIIIKNINSDKFNRTIQ